MKSVFFAVLLVNVVFFLWEFQHDTLRFGEDSYKTPDSAKKQILLLSELDKQPVSAGTTIAENGLETDAASASGSVNKPSGPKADEKQVDRTETGQASELQRVAKVEQVQELSPESVSEEGLLQREVAVRSGQDRVPADEASVVASVAENVSQAVGSRLCYEVGPFSDESQMTEWLTTRHLAGLAEPFYKEQQAVSAYMVYVPAADTFAESKRNVSMLRQQGVDELWLFRQGKMRGAISLGLFKEKSHAEILFKRMTEKGINVNIDQRHTKEQSLYARVLQRISESQASDLSITECEIK